MNECVPKMQQASKLPGQGPLVLAGEFWRRVVVVDGQVVVAEDVVACGVGRGMCGCVSVSSSPLSCVSLSLVLA